MVHTSGGVAGGSPGEFTHTSCGRHGGGSENTDGAGVPKCSGEGLFWCDFVASVIYFNAWRVGSRNVEGSAGMCDMTGTSRQCAGVLGTIVLESMDNLGIHWI